MITRLTPAINIVTLGNTNISLSRHPEYILLADYCANVEPGDVIKTLNGLYDIFDDICDRTGVYKVTVCVICNNSAISVLKYHVKENFICLILTQGTPKQLVNAVCAQTKFW